MYSILLWFPEIRRLIAEREVTAIWQSQRDSLPPGARDAFDASFNDVVDETARRIHPLRILRIIK